MDDVYSLGETGLSDYDLEEIDLSQFDWFVYDYKYECYEGNGIAVGRVNGELRSFDLGHCSCYGPLDSNNYSVVTLEELESDEMYVWSDDQKNNVLAKVRELIS